MAAATPGDWQPPRAGVAGRSVTGLISKLSNGTWSTVNIPFSSFIPKYRGYQLDGPALDPGQITGMGLMIYDNQDGPFELHLASVRAYAADAPLRSCSTKLSMDPSQLQADADQEKDSTGPGKAPFKNRIFDRRQNWDRQPVDATSRRSPREHSERAGSPSN